MIVPMKKVSIVLLDKEKLEAVRALKKVGVMHLEELTGKGEILASYKDKHARALSAYSVLSEIKTKKRTDKRLSMEEKEELSCRVMELCDKRREAEEEISVWRSELERLSLWGEIEPSDFAYLETKGVSLSLYEIPSDKFETLPKEASVIRVNDERKVTRFLLVNPDEEMISLLPSEAFHVNLPSLSTAIMKLNIAENEKKISVSSRRLTECALYLEELKEYLDELEEEIQFENVYSGMGREESEEEASLAWLTGFVPEDDMESVKRAAKKNSWALSWSEPSEEDAVPTKLRNNRFVSLIYPLTDFLGTVPGYREYDISGWFLAFFVLFFGMIFGDGGYGLLITLISLFMIKKGKRDVGGLVFLLGVGTVAWGMVTCTWFGLTPEQLPSWLKHLSIPQISSAYGDVKWLPFWLSDTSKGVLTNAQNLQVFCFVMAVIQLSVAHFKGISRNVGSFKALGELGSLLQLWGMLYVVFSMVISPSIFSFSEIIYGVPVGKVATYLVAGGFALSFVFANYEGNLVASIMASVKGIISVLLGVVNVFSDIVSYIRLWAVGLAGAAISGTVNSMAGPLLGHAILFVAAVVLLLFGHGLNMVLNLLSVIVHGVRLNTLEFSMHLGMSWSGFKYSPFCESKI